MGRRIRAERSERYRLLYARAFDMAESELFPADPPATADGDDLVAAYRELCLAEPWRPAAQKVVKWRKYS
jgi:hypothetical protein